MPEIEFVINPDGTIDVDGKGFSGPDCEEKIRKYLKVLGQVRSEKRKDDFYRVLTVGKQSQKV